MQSVLKYPQRSQGTVYNQQTVLPDDERLAMHGVAKTGIQLFNYHYIVQSTVYCCTYVNINCSPGLEMLGYFKLEYCTKLNFFPAWEVHATILFKMNSFYNKSDLYAVCNRKCKFATNYMFVNVPVVRNTEHYQICGYIYTLEASILIVFQCIRSLILLAVCVNILQMKCRTLNYNLSSIISISNFVALQQTL